MFTLRKSPNDDYAVEIWLNQVVEALSPSLVELYIDFDESKLGYVSESTGPAASATQSSVLAALTEPDRDRLRVTILGLTGQRLISGHLGTIYFAPLTAELESSSLYFDLSQYQVAPAYIYNYVTFGIGHPEAMLSLP